MADMLADGAAMVADSLSEHASQTVIYQRGTRQITGVKAARGTPSPLIDQQTGAYLEILGLRWFIKPALLVYLAETWEPQPTDVIIETNGQRWEVLPTDVQPAVVKGSFGELWRIETKRIES